MSRWCSACAQVPPTETATELDGAFLVGQIFGVPERQIEESLQLRGDDAVVACVDRGIGELARRRVGRVHARRAAKGIARELVEQNHECERAGGRRVPAVELAARGRLVQWQEALAKAPIERVVLGEPERGTRTLPERNDFPRLSGRYRFAVRVGGGTRRGASQGGNHHSSHCYELLKVDDGAQGAAGFVLKPVI